MRVGFEIFAKLAGTYPLYRGGEVAARADEVFPHATACLLAGGLRARSESKEHFRREVLRSAGVREDRLRTLDQVDAALGALTGAIALEGGHSWVGTPEEGMILLPVPQVPSRPLLQAPVDNRLRRGAQPGYIARRAEDVVSATSKGRAPATGFRGGGGSPTRRPLDFGQAARFVAAVPAGRWTSYKDVATVAGNNRGAQAVGGWLRRRGDEIPNVHRVIRSDGLVAEGFRAAGLGGPADAPMARELLKREGVTFDVQGRASERERFGPEHWRAS